MREEGDAVTAIAKTEQGQSAIATEGKQRGLMAAFAVNLGIFQRKHGSNPRAKYLHVDLNSGSGFNDNERGEVAVVKAA